MFLPIIVVHWLHVLAGIVWFGGGAAFVFVIWPTLLGRPARESRSLYEALARPAGLMFASVGNATVLLGLLRGTWLGQIRSLHALTATPYGHTFLTALLLTVAFIAFGGVMRGKLPARVWNGDAYQPGAARFLRWTAAVEIVMMVLILACMVAMHFGL
jgi:putative copper export protein